jgi:hypothetical protein
MSSAVCVTNGYVIAPPATGCIIGVHQVAAASGTPHAAMTLPRVSNTRRESGLTIVR